MKKGTQATGKRGEDEASEYLRGLGHTILERNWRSSHLEIDIISADPRGVHFVEVKSRTAPVMASPEENVRADKQRRLARAAQSYLHKVKLPPGIGDETFFDVISVVFDGPAGAPESCTGGKVLSLEYFPQAWIPMYF